MGTGLPPRVSFSTCSFKCIRPGFRSIFRARKKLTPLTDYRETALSVLGSFMLNSLHSHASFDLHLGWTEQRRYHNFHVDRCIYRRTCGGQNVSADRADVSR